MKIRYFYIEQPALWILLLVTVCVLIGIVASFINVTWFESVYTVEDGFIEWLTVLGLLSVSGIMFYRFLKLRNHKVKLFLSTMFLSGILGLFGIGEEVSWGQRILQIDSPELFVKHNAQKETNIHNMVVRGKKINKVVFSQLLMVFILLYLVFFPVAYNRSESLKGFIDNKAGIPVPRLYQVFFFLLFMGIIGISPSGKRAELMEFSSTFVFLIIFLYPQNKYIFSLKKGSEKVMPEPAPFTNKSESLQHHYF